MRVLIASDDPALVPSQLEAYAALGCDVSSGMRSFYSCSGACELIHLHWPEELVGWKLPTNGALEKLTATLREWQKHSRIVATVHNLLPHRASEHPLDRRLYETVYSSADLIGHFSEHSLKTVLSFFPNLDASKHLVHPPFLYAHMRRFAVGRELARQRFNLTGNQFAILVFGALRTAAEFDLIMRCLGLCDLPNMRILFAGRFAPRTKWKRMLSRLRMQWLRGTTSAEIFRGVIADAEATSMFEASDVVLIPRSRQHLNSGVMSLAMPLGTPIVAPKHGAFLEHLGETVNVLYEPGNHRAMAAAIREIAKRDRCKISFANISCASNWGWDKSVRCYAQAVRPNAG
jgi:glycosyltransferase involved in cell wall biosynthesis